MDRNPPHRTERELPPIPTEVPTPDPIDRNHDQSRLAIARGLQSHTTHPEGVVERNTEPSAQDTIDRRAMSDSTTQGAPGQQPVRGGGIDRDAMLRARLEAIRLNAGGTAVDAHATSPRLDPSSGVSGTQRPGRGGSTAEVRPAGASRYSRAYVNENMRAMDNGLPFTSAAEQRLRDQFNYGITAADYARIRRAASAPNVVVTTPAPAPFPAAPDVPMVGTMPEVGHVAYITVQTPEGRFYTVRVDLSNAAPRAVYNFVINIDAFP